MSQRTVAALYVLRDGVYSGRPDVEVWDATRDARTYAGPWPVVAHPPCARWCRLAGLVEARWGYKRGEDGGCFASALAAVRRWGGVLEHPAYSAAWAAHGLAAPTTGGGWERDCAGGWSCYVEQRRYGHSAKKATWLYYFGEAPPPALRWGHVPDRESRSSVSWCGNPTRMAAYVTDGKGDARRRNRAAQPSVSALAGLPLFGTDPGSFSPASVPASELRRRLSKLEANATPPEFAELLLSIARASNVAPRP